MVSGLHLKRYGVMCCTDPDVSRLTSGRWLFTSKHGTIISKKPGHITPDAVLERFSRFSGMNPLNKEKVVASVTLHTGETTFLRKEPLSRLLSDAHEGRQQLSDLAVHQVQAVQVYLRPRDGAEETFFGEYTYGATPRVRYSRSIGRSRSRDEDLPDGWDEVAKKQMEDAVLSIVRHIEASQPTQVKSIRVSFILDDNHQTWIVGATGLQLQSHVMDSRAAEDTERFEDSSLPPIPNHSNHSTPRTYSRKVLIRHITAIVLIDSQGMDSKKRSRNNLREDPTVQSRDDRPEDSPHQATQGYATSHMHASTTGGKQQRSVSRGAAAAHADKVRAVERQLLEDLATQR